MQVGHHYVHLSFFKAALEDGMLVCYFVEISDVVCACMQTFGAAKCSGGCQLSRLHLLCCRVMLP